VGDLVARRFPAAWALPRRGGSAWLLWSGCPGLLLGSLGQLDPLRLLQAAWRPPLSRLLEAARAGATPVSTDRAHRPPAGGRIHGGNGNLPCLPPAGASPRDSASPGPWPSWDRPPLALYWMGHGTLWPRLRERLAIAVVGTRRPSCMASRWRGSWGGLAKAGLALVVVCRRHR